jgi:hypothetical protein
MNTHPYLRAYLAGIAIPTAFMLVVFSFFCVMRYWFRPDVPIERVIIFPLALVPNAWGLWNVLRLALPRPLRLPLGLHGAVLVALIMAAAYLIGRTIESYLPPHFFQVVALFFPVAIIGYYLVWKYMVGFLNTLLGVTA